MKFYRGCLGVLGILLIWMPTAQGLQWTVVEAVLRTQADGVMPVASYGFRNDTSAPVTITRAVPSCDCTTVELVKKAYGPGESGVLVARFDPTGRSGTVSRTINVITDEPGGQPQLLRLTAELPEVLTFTPQDLRWAADEKATAKTLDVLVNTPGGVELAAAWANHPDFKVELVTVTPRTHYRVKVTPPEGAKSQQALILLRAAGTVPAGTGLTFYARVK
ncbi:MAG: DUF1573 domain-containing protein [Undibacterium sp.]|nr:DUF1573 domain-containing protein [Opitutaceae bacterium]